LKRGFRDRDYLQTAEDYFFTVVGNVHPRDRVIAYLKNIPSERGRWGSEGRRYKRVLKQYTMRDISETMHFLRMNHPEYIHHSEELNITFSFVPVNRIKAHHRPEEKLAKLLAESGLDSLQRKVVRLARAISEESGVSLSSLGVTGSLLVDIHRPEFSDIDLTVYGVEASMAVKEGMLRMYEDGLLGRIEGVELKKWCRRKAKLYPLTVEEAWRLYARKWNRGRFEGSLFSVHPIKVESEVWERYGSRTYVPLGIVECEAVVEDSSGSMFMPAVYKVGEVSIVKGEVRGEVAEIVSFEGLYADIASEGEKVVCRGKLERVTDKESGKAHYRILVGSSEAEGTDYIKPALWRNTL